MMLMIMDLMNIMMIIEYEYDYVTALYDDSQIKPILQCGFYSTHVVFQNSPTQISSC